jgi:hypothetical protein
VPLFTTHTLYGVPHGILGVFNTILYENEFQNPQIFSIFREQSTLAAAGEIKFLKNIIEM